MDRKVLIVKSEEGYYASCPELPGCWSQGNSREEASENVMDAIKKYLRASNGSEEKDSD